MKRSAMKGFAGIVAGWALLGSPGLAQPWNLALCGPEHTASRQSFREALVRARPESPKYVPHPFPQTPDQVVEDVSTAHGWKPSAGQYVTLWGSFRCDLIDPCLGFRVGPRAYLLRGEHLYRIATEKARFSIREEMAEVASKRRFLGAFEGGPEKVITLGHDVMALAVPVPP